MGPRVALRRDGGAQDVADALTGRVVQTASPAWVLRDVSIGVRIRFLFVRKPRWGRGFQSAVGGAHDPGLAVEMEQQHLTGSHIAGARGPPHAGRVTATIDAWFAFLRLEAPADERLRLQHVEKIRGNARRRELFGFHAAVEREALVTG